MQQEWNSCVYPIAGRSGQWRIVYTLGVRPGFSHPPSRHAALPGRACASHKQAATAYNVRPPEISAATGTCAARYHHVSEHTRQ